MGEYSKIYWEKRRGIIDNINKLSDAEFLAKRDKILKVVTEFNTRFQNLDYSIRLEIDKRIVKEESGIPSSYTNKSFDNFNVDAKSTYGDILNTLKYYTDNFDTLGLEQGYGFLLSSGDSRGSHVGTGKTHLACAVANQLQNDKLLKNVRFINVTDLKADLKEAWSDKTTSDSAILEFYSSASLLIIDDLGKEKIGKAEWSNSIIYHVINKRYSNLSPTIITTELTKEQLKDYYGESTSSRMIERNKLLLLDGSNQRYSIPTWEEVVDSSKKRKTSSSASGKKDD